MEMIGMLNQIAGPIVEYSWNFEEKKQNLKRKLQELESLEADVTTKLESEENSTGKKRKNEVKNWLGNVHRIKNKVHSLELEMGESGWRICFGRVERMTGEVLELIEKGRFQGGLVLDGPETGNRALLTTKLVGESFRTNIEKIWAWLMTDNVSTIGIYGMGGVGKTALMTHIHNLLLERPDSFHHVYWVTVSQEFSITKLQNQIATTIGYDFLLIDDDSMKRAAKLSRALLKKQRCVLILDDLWNHFTLEEVGIPTRFNGCKLILTTRSLDICRRMGCQENIRVVPLSEDEGLSLFQEKLGNYQSLSSQIKQIAESVAMECDGLPLGIITMAGSMRGVDDVHEWRNVLEELKESKFRHGDMEDKVFRILKYSYSRLNDEALQQSFLYCALHPVDFKFKRTELIECLITEGIIKAMKTRQAEIDKGHAILNKLVNACLLESCIDEYNCRWIKMHDVIRDMAIKIMEVSPRAMVEAGAQLTELPDEERWTEDLLRVSLVENSIKQIPSNHLPRCPNLLTLLLRNNLMLESIGDSFFKQLPSLKVLDLSYTGIRELPGSISDMMNLTSLTLSHCGRLNHVPSLSKLRALKKLDLCHSRIEQVPEGVEFLSRLRYLDLYETRLEEFPPGLLPKLFSLQYFRLCSFGIGETSMTVNAEEVMRLKRLETLCCNFSDFNEYNGYFQALTSDRGLDQENEKQQLVEYILLVGKNHRVTDLTKTWTTYVSRAVYFSYCHLSREGEDALVCLPEDIQLLNIGNCYIRKGLCFANATNLQSFRITCCDEIEWLFSVPSSYTILQCLEILDITHLNNLRVLFSRGGGSPPALASNGTFLHLTKLIIEDCSSMRKLLPSVLLPNLQNLEIVEVRGCSMMEEIISTEDEEEQTNSSTTLPKLRHLLIEDLPQLLSIWSGKLICASLHEISAINCQKLKKIPVSLPVPSLQRIHVYPQQWWESVEWGQPNAKNDLQSLVHVQHQDLVMVKREQNSQEQQLGNQKQQQKKGAKTEFKVYKRHTHGPCKNKVQGIVNCGHNPFLGNMTDLIYLEMML